MTGLQAIREFYRRFYAPLVDAIHVRVTTAIEERTLEGEVPAVEVLRAEDQDGPWRGCPSAPMTRSTVSALPSVSVTVASWRFWEIAGSDRATDLHKLGDLLIQGTLLVAAEQDPQRGASGLGWEAEARSELADGVDLVSAPLGASPLGSALRRPRRWAAE